jgi:hypothetical protein
MLSKGKNLENKMDKQMGNKNTEKINQRVIRDIRENLGVDPNDTSKDDEIDRMSLGEIFNRWCEWNGLINWSGKIKTAIGDIYGMDIERRVVVRQQR